MRTFTTGWLRTGLIVLVASVLMALPFVLPVWLLQLWLLPRLGWPALDPFEVLAVVLLLRWLQPSVLLTPSREVGPEPAAPVKPDPELATEPDEARAADRCNCPACRTRPGEAVPFFSRLPRLAMHAADRRRAEGAGVLFLVGDDDQNPIWIPVALLDRVDENEPEAMDYLRAALARARESGTDPRKNLIIAVLDGTRVALYVVGDITSHQAAREELTA